MKIAWINLYLNALDDDGLPIYDSEGKTLLDRVEFHESDLLSYCRDNKIELDRIVGCIPQVHATVPMFAKLKWKKKNKKAYSQYILFQILNPNPEAMSKIITENSSEEFLYSLSNYCALQVSLRMPYINSSLIQNAVSSIKLKPCYLVILTFLQVFSWSGVRVRSKSIYAHFFMQLYFLVCMFNIFLLKHQVK